MTLLSDSPHTMVPFPAQGAAQAIRDAAVLDERGPRGCHVARGSPRARPVRESAALDRHERAGRCRASGRGPPAAGVDPATRPYHSRPFQVLRADRFSKALTARITDPTLRDLLPVGSVDQFLDSTDVLSRPKLTRAAGHAVRKSRSE
ncbi:hypothetical protein [Streptomyces mirabilis]|uniref:hypothetical protein n=1 Tax=Streptomyces mirabilis TaxID=68239 RepID=UPI00367F2981